MMTNEQAALIAAAQVVSGMLTNGWFKTNVKDGIEKTTNEFMDRFLLMLPPVAICDYCGVETEIEIKDWYLGKEDQGNLGETMTLKNTSDNRD